MFDLYEVIRLKKARPDLSLAAGSVGTIVEIYTDPQGYEIEFADSNGETLAQFALSAEQIESTTPMRKAA